MLRSRDLALLRERDFARLDEAEETYLDYTGAALAPASLVAAHRPLLEQAILGNPHSSHAASRRSTRLIDQARLAVLRFFRADPSTHVVCFTGNASGAIKLVGESYPFGPRTSFGLSADNHNSVNGIREYARRARARIVVAPIDDDLRLRDAESWLDDAAAGDGGLVAFPAQSNFSGVRHPLNLVESARARGLDVLLDAAAFAPSGVLDLSSCTANFVAVSFYKMFGYPTGVGALIARRESIARLPRPWFAGGAVDYVSIQNDRHLLRAAPNGFEDGTPNFLAIGAIPAGLAFLERIGPDAIGAHVLAMTERLLLSLQAVRHSSGAQLVIVYGPRDMRARGGVIAFNVLTEDGAVIPYDVIETALSDHGVFVRGGCFCNPGAAEAAFRFDADAANRCLTTLDGRFNIPEFARCLGQGVAVGALRASVGLATDQRDLARTVAAIARFRDDARGMAHERAALPGPALAQLVTRSVPVRDRV